MSKAEVERSVVHRFTIKNLQIDLTHKHDELIREIGNHQKGGHDDLLPDFIEWFVQEHFLDYLEKKKKDRMTLGG